MIIVVAFALVLVSLTLAPGRGLLWRRLRQLANRRTYAGINTLRDLYRYALSHGAADHPVPDSFIRGIQSRGVESGLGQLRAADQVQETAEGWRLTPHGIQAARHDQRNQELWDLYRLHGHELGLPPLQEDRQQDISERLPAPALAKLLSLREGGEQA